MAAKFPTSISISTCFCNFFFFLLLCNFFSSSISQQWVRSGYYISRSEIPVSDIASALFTHLICSFAYINSSTFELSINSSELPKFSSFTSTVRRKNNRIITLLSVWAGGDDPAIFESMVGNSSSRQFFINSSIKAARSYGFNGLDLFGFVPSETTNMTNFGTFLDELREGTDSESKTSRKTRLLLTMAGYCQKVFDVSYPIDSISRSLDWLHIIAYDYHLPTKERYIYPHAPLFDPQNTDFCITVYITRGFPANKLVLGLPFHGYAWKLENVNENYVGSPADGPVLTGDGSIGYKIMKSYIRDIGYGTTPVYNSTYVVDIFIKESYWVNFDGPDVIGRKVDYSLEKGLLGYNVFQVSNDADWVLSQAAKEASEGRKRNQTLLPVAIATAALGILLLFGVIFYLRGRRISRGFLGVIKGLIQRSKCGMGSRESLESDTPNLQVFSYATLKAATNNFSAKNKLGEGGFGPVYKGKLCNDQEIAVKKLSKNSNQGLEEFKNEVMLTARLQHVNLLRVLGFCTDREEKMLIYEYMPGKSLDFYLFDPVRRYYLDWDKRLQIIEGVTQGLLYLQEYSNCTIVHRDLKACNILLDSEWNPKISDFGIARIFRKNELEANTGRIVGTSLDNSCDAAVGSS
ncbi:class V chitinase-like isoform X3 [Punica granatum]|uniref:non-specific serine/threonine protein kinase n=1 Tax=Punica granatum TaxID=22663 RepID=A0A6P8CL29_PUNGR|nr:class V chitinase-like isoform X3 [Punica granatum]